jgi:hypothetical protein
MALISSVTTNTMRDEPVTIDFAVNGEAVGGNIYLPWINR